MEYEFEDMIIKVKIVNGELIKSFYCDEKLVKRIVYPQTGKYIVEVYDE